MPHGTHTQQITKANLDDVTGITDCTRAMFLTKRPESCWSFIPLRTMQTGGADLLQTALLYESRNVAKGGMLPDAADDDFVPPGIGSWLPVAFMLLTHLFDR